MYVRIPLSDKSDFIFLGLFDLHLKVTPPQNENFVINHLPFQTRKSLVCLRNTI